jgi:hypothetical protein
LAVTQISCENNDDFEEIMEKSELEISAKKDKKTHRMAEANKAFAHFGRKRTKSKRYIFTVITENESINDVSRVSVEIEKKDGFIDETQTYELSLKNENKKIKRFTSENIIINNEKIIGENINVKITLFDSNNKQIGEPDSRTMIVSDEKVNYIRTSTNIKQRANGLYRSTVVLKDKNNEVNSVALEIEKKEGFIKETKTYYLDYFTTLKGEKHYTFGDIKFENKEIENQEITVNITFLDAKKEVIGNSTDVITVAGLANANIKTGRTYLKQRRSGLYKLTTEIEDPENEVAAVELTVTDLKGNNATINTAPKNNNTIKADFSFQKESIANTFLVISSLKDLFGDVIGEFKEEVVISSDIIGNPILTQNDDKKTFSLTIPLDRKQLGKDYKDLKIYVQLKATNSKNYYEGTNFSFLEITKGSVIYENNNIAFKDLKNIAKNEFIASITVTSEHGDLDDDETKQAKNRRVTFVLL